MRTRLLIVLLLIVVLPLLLLGSFGMRLISSEQQALEHRFQALIEAQLQAIDERIVAYFSVVAQQLTDAADDLALDSETLRRFTRQTPQLRQMFVISAGGDRLHPPADAQLSVDEQQFLQRTEALWRDKNILYQARDNDTSQSGNSGWYVWYWGVETNLIFWLRDSDARLIGFELDPVRVLADIINRLPATGSSDDTLGAARVQLADSRGSVIYQWGAFEPVTEQAAQLVRPLSHPLSGWQLAYYAAELAATPGRFRLLTLAIVLALAAVLAGLAYYLYREHTREMRLAQQRVNFVNQVSHELKTPLTNIRMYAELLDEQLPDDDGDGNGNGNGNGMGGEGSGGKSRRYLQIIVSESQRLSRLITNVLSFAGLQKQHLQLHRRPGSVDDVVATALAAFRPLLHNKGVEIRLTSAAAGVVWLDSDIVEQILNNLLGNVEKYAASGARLDIATRRQGDYSYIRMRDYGPGIAKREREKIFRPFYRISSQLADGVTGTGIGLTITRELARLHGGGLQLLSAEPGACFEVSLYTAKGDSE